MLENIDSFIRSCNAADPQNSWLLAGDPIAVQSSSTVVPPPRYDGFRIPLRFTFQHDIIVCQCRDVMWWYQRRRGRQDSERDGCGFSLSGQVLHNTGVVSGVSRLDVIDE
ncbi:hypothetical protein RvY_00923 [Ramazzottius varieornatus]|uniref:Uncharacterized protein n=1 Tax=Ramazzottius varieornatus TaxID=947166 RepID=A0A1D1UPU8_RAMVA|nr:hypothetical protein RvY_00923 [Ramazzottius varieornatus]